jgi:hypothetical protein
VTYEIGKVRSLALDNFKPLSVFGYIDESEKGLNGYKENLSFDS